MNSIKKYFLVLYLVNLYKLIKVEIFNIIYLMLECSQDNTEDITYFAASLGFLSKGLFEYIEMYDKLKK